MASRENERAMDGLLRRSLARDGAAKGVCPAPESLAAYYDRSLGETELAEYDLHFSHCTRCREQLAMMARAGAQTDVALDLAPAARGAGRVAVAAQRSTAASAESKVALAAQSRPRRLLDLRWLVPVAAVLVLSTFVFVRFASHVPSAAVSNQVAMSKSASPPQDQVNSQPQTAAVESRALDKTAEKSTESDSPSSSGQPSSAQSSASAQSRPNAARKRTEEAPSPRASAASRNSGASGSRTARAGHNAIPANGSNRIVRPPMVGTIVTPRFPSEPAPAAPAPELNAALPSIAVAADAATPAPPPAPAARSSAGSARTMNGLGLSGRSSHGAATRSAPAAAKSAGGRLAAPVIATPDPNVIYRIQIGGFIERSQDRGATWQGQLLDSSAELRAASAPTPNICWVVGRAGVVFITDDGKNWRNVSIPGATDLTSVVAKDELSATVTSTDDQRWSTEDGGKTWTSAE
jgi:hypothetical protein